MQRLEFYSVEELSEIVRRSARILEVEIDSKGAGEIAARSRGTPRIANRLLRRVRDYAQVQGRRQNQRRHILARIGYAECRCAWL